MKTKTILACLAAASILISLGTTGLSAAETAKSVSFTAQTPKTVCNFCGKDCSFVDKDGDGVCDNYASGKCGGSGIGRRRICGGNGGNRRNRLCGR